MATTVTEKSEILLNSVKYRIKGQVKGGWQDPFPNQISIGDPTYANRIDLSSWVINDLRGGIGVEEMDEAVDAKKCWWTNCIIPYRNHILPPRKATAITMPGYAGGPITNADMETASSGWTNATRSSTRAYSGTYSYSVAAEDPVTEGYQDLTWNSAFQGKKVKFWCWGAPAVGSSGTNVRIGINDGVDTTYSSAHTGASAWELLTVEKTLSASATRLRLILGNTSSVGIAYFDDAGVTSLDLPELMVNFNGVLYFSLGQGLFKLNAARDGLTLVRGFPVTITALISSLNSRLYIYLGDSTNYFYMSTAEAFTQSNSANANWGFQYDAKLYKVNTSGTVAYSTDPDGATPTWTAGGNITDIAAQIESFELGRDASGVITPYCATNSVLKALDSATPRWEDTEVKLPNHPIGGKGFTFFNGKLYLSYGLGVKEYYPETGSLIDIGLTERDGLPAEYNGEIVKLLGDSGSEGMFALIDASVPSGNSKSGLYVYDALGWQCWWTPPIVLIEDCEDAWNELVDADVTASLDTTDFQVGAGSAKFVCAAGLAAGDIIATELISSTDLSGYSHISFRIKSTVALSASDLQLLLDNTAQCASPLETLNIPAVSANEWTKVDIALAAASSDTAIISVGLKMAVDKGAFTVNIDQIEGQSYNGAMNAVIVSSASSGYAVYWDCDKKIYYIDIPRGVQNPDKISQSYAAAGILITPWFDAGNPVAAKSAKMLTDYAKSITTTETVALKYRIDHTYTDLDTGWTLLDTLNTTGESGYNEEKFASGAGLAFKAIQFRLDFVTPGATAKPDIQSLVFYYKKRTGSEKIRTWEVTVICDDYAQTGIKQKVANLKTAITSATDVLFSYHPNDASDESYYVSVNCPMFSEETGRSYEANYTLQLVESK